MKKLIFALIIVLLALNVYAQRCQDVGVKCSECCKNPVSSDNSKICCEEKSCVDRLQTTAIVPLLGNVTFEKLDDEKYVVWYGDSKNVFGKTKFVYAEKLGNKLSYTINNQDYETEISDTSCGFNVLKTTSKKNCIVDRSCDFTLMFVPVDNWLDDQALFENLAKQRADFFQDISLFKEKNFGIIYVPIDYVKKNCDVANIRNDHTGFLTHLKMKNCADSYSDAIGADYDRAVGFSDTFGQGYAFFINKIVFVPRGFDNIDFPSVASHELGHTYWLCDEYSYKEYSRENTEGIVLKCKNKFPDYCKESNDCDGNTPVYREYSQTYLKNVCEGDVKYSVMGPTGGYECGYDKTGGYNAIQ